MKDSSLLDRARANVLGIGIDAIDMPTAVARIIAAAEARSGGYVCVTGVHGVMEAQRDPALRRILNASIVTTPDGMPMVWVGRAQGHDRISRVYGPSLMLEVCRASVGRGLTHFLYGGADGVAEELRSKLTTRFPGLQIVGTYTPPFRPLSPEEELALAAQLAEAKPDFLWVGLSTPKQERFMAQYQGRLDAGVMLGVGAAFDMHSGRTRQAPHWMQQSGLEWFYRLTQEPRRLWKRYAVNNPAFVFRMFLQSFGLSRYSIEESA